MDQDGSNGGGEIKEIFNNKNIQNKVINSYGFLMCKNKLISTGKRPSWKSKGDWESLILEVPSLRCLETIQGR